jgi:galactose mutarotase-like enzyme
MKATRLGITIALTALMQGPFNNPISAAEPEVGGAKPVLLERGHTGNDLQFTSAEILPGRGWNIYQVKAWIPGHGEVGLLESPPLSEGAAIMNGGPDDRIGNKSFSFGGAILIPYANRITGPMTNNGRDIIADIAGTHETLPANWGGKKPGARQYAMHGLILDAKIQNVSTTLTSARGTLDAGNFGGRWPSDTKLQFKSTLDKGAFDLQVIATNSGTKPLPLGIGWHPYFHILSGKREQVKLYIPATERAPANNYDEVLPLGNIEKVSGTPFDFTAKGGHTLGDLFMDDTFTDLIRTDGKVVAEVIDPASGYGIRIISDTPQVKAMQVYAPTGKQFIVVEPQFNLADPFSPVWKGKPTGMIMLKPGESVTYHARLELFHP